MIIFIIIIFIIMFFITNFIDREMFATSTFEQNHKQNFQNFFSLEFRARSIKT